MNVDQQIAELAARRQKLWREDGSPAEIERCAAQLKDLYELRRKERAERDHGNPAEIIRRARIESELERLMSSNGENPH